MDNYKDSLESILKEGKEIIKDDYAKLLKIFDITPNLTILEAIEIIKKAKVESLLNVFVDFRIEKILHMAEDFVQNSFVASYEDEEEDEDEIDEIKITNFENFS